MAVSLKNIVFFIAFYGFFSLKSFAALQPQQIDSIKKIIPQSDEYKQSELLMNLCWELRASNVDDALKYGLKAIDIIQRRNYIQLLPKAYNYLGVIYRNIGKLGDAQSCFVEALKVAESNNNLEQIGYAKNNIADIFIRAHQFQDAEKYVLSAVEIFQTHKDTMGLSYAYNQLAMLNQLKENYNKALFYNKIVLRLRKLVKDENGTYVSYKNIGVCYIRINKFDSAEYFLKLSMNAQFCSKNKNLLANLYEAYGLLAVKKHNNETAIQNYQRSIELYTSIKGQDGIKASAFELYKIFKQQNQAEKALEYLEIYTKANNLLLNQTSLINVYGVVDKYKNKKEKELQQKVVMNITIIRNIIISALALTLVLLALLIVRNRTIKNQNRTLTEQHNSIVIQNQLLEQQKGELNDLNITKDKFFSIVAHDLKNPLGAILGLTQLMTTNFDDYSKKELQEYGKVINDSTKNLYDLMNNLLTWAKSQRGLVEYNPETIHLRDLIHNVIKIAYNQAKHKNINIESDIPGEIAIVADQNMIATVIRNLLSNATKFTEEEGTISIRAFKDEGKVIISIRDTGIGIPDTIRDRIFKLDTKVSTQGTKGEHGTGLGLVLCKEFVEKNKGKIWFTSEPGNGTTFYISF